MGEWIPEPLPEPRDWINTRSGGTTADPADRVTLDESVGMAFLVVLESMTPAERVAFILHDVFRYSYVEIAEVVGRTPAACRQLASSARRRIRTSQAGATPAAQQARIVRDFKRAWETKDLKALIGLLDPGATAIADGGGLAVASLRPIEGAEQVARYYIDLAGLALSNVTILERLVNGQPGLVARQDGVTVTVFAFDVTGDRIKNIWAVRNPEKLRPWTAGSTRVCRPRTAPRVELAAGKGGWRSAVGGELGQDRGDAEVGEEQQVLAGDDAAQLVEHWAMVTVGDCGGVPAYGLDERFDVPALCCEQVLVAGWSVADVQGCCGGQVVVESVDDVEPVRPLSIGEVGVHPVVRDVTDEQGSRRRAPRWCRRRTRRDRASGRAT